MAVVQFTSTISAGSLGRRSTGLLITTERLVGPLIQHMPQGRKVWVFEPGTVLMDLIRGCARAIGWVDALGRSEVRQLDPSKATWGVAKWEEILGLSAGSLSLAKRRQNVISALRARGGQSIAYWKAILIALGYTDIVITRLGDPFRCGDRCGHRLQGPDWMFALEFAATSIPDQDDLMQEVVLAGVRATTLVKFTLA